MCGIFAYIGKRKDAAPLVIKGLKKLEYRGYDSWGIAFENNQKLQTFKQVGKISEFDDNANSFPESSLAISHSRWATHGGVTQENAHPHTNAAKTIAVVHNGIIENHEEIRNQLKGKGYEFVSQTDTEVIPHLIDDLLKSHDFESAIKEALKILHGRYALLILKNDEHKLIAARRGSPLIIGKNNNEFFIASDIPAFLEYTQTVNYLDDDQMVVIDEKPIYYDLKTDKTIEKRDIQIEWKAEQAEKGDYPHFMIKEIMEQKDTIYRAIHQDDAEILKVAEAIKNAYGTYFIGCGTAGKVAMAAEYQFAKIAKRHINSVVGSEFACFQEFIKPKSLLVAISQSGETADNLEAIKIAKEKGSTVVSIINVEGSSMDRESDFSIHIKAGPEKAVASTKATTGQLAIITLLAFACAGKLNEGKKLLIETASEINDFLNPRYEEHIAKLAEKIKSSENMYIIGKSTNYIMALEAAIKLQEVSYIHAEGFASGELKHGPLALITNGTPVIALITNDETKSDALSNAYEVKARGGYIIGISPENHEIFDYWIKVPDIAITSPILNIIPIQLLAYHLAILRENNPDMPRNLAKSVTVK